MSTSEFRSVSRWLSLGLSSAVMFFPKTRNRYPGTLPILAKIFGFKFWKFFLSKGKASSMRANNLQSRCASKFASRRNENFVQLDRRKRSTSEDRPFVPENFHLIGSFYLHFNKLNPKNWLNGKRPCSTKVCN